MMPEEKILVWLLIFNDSSCNFSDAKSKIPGVTNNF